MPIITTGGPDFSGLAEDLNRIDLSRKAQALDEKRFKAIQDLAEKRFTLESEAAKRQQEAFDIEKQDHERSVAEQEQAKVARQKAAGLYADQVSPPSLEPMNPFGTQTWGDFAGSVGRNSDKARKYAATQSAARALAENDPEQAQKFIEFRAKEIHAEGVREAVTGLSRTMGHAATDGLYSVKGMNGEPTEDATYTEGMKQDLQLLEAAYNLEPDKAVQVIAEVAQRDQVRRDEIKARTTLNLSKGRKALKANETLAMAAQGGHVPESRIDKAQSIIVNMESGDYDGKPGGQNDLVSFSEDFQMALEGKILVSIGGVKVPVDEEWFKQYQASEMEKVNAASAAYRALVPQREAAANASNAKARGLDLPGNGKEVKTLDRAKLVQDEVKSLRASTDDPKVTDEQLRAQAIKNVDAMLKKKSPEAQLQDEIDSGKITTAEQLKKRAAELGARLKE